MYHGIPLNYDLIVFAFAMLAWIGRSLYKGFRAISRQVRGVSLSTPRQSPLQKAIAEAQQEVMAQEPGPLPTPKIAQALPSRTAPLLGQRREMPRQPDAGGPAVPREATEDEMRRQERELFASEPAALATPLTDRAVSAVAVPRPLFGSTGDLVRAIILQEVLGPPLSRRRSHTPSTPQ